MRHYKFADVRWNGGEGALLCTHCKRILAYGFDHEDKEVICEDCFEQFGRKTYAQVYQADD